MSTPSALANRVDYRRLATQHGRVAGEIGINRLGRVAAEMADDRRADQTVAVDLVLSEDSQRRVRVNGTIDTTLRLECQRCLQPFDQSMHVEVAGVVVSDDASAADVPRADEPLLADGDVLEVHALVADELLLALPSVARCARPECTSRYAEADTPAPQDSTKRRTDNPFAVLGELKRDD